MRDPKKPPRSYLWNVMVCLSQLGRALIGGREPNESISGWLGTLELKGNRAACLFCKALSFVLRDPNHCVNSIEVRCDHDDHKEHRP